MKPDARNIQYEKGTGAQTGLRMKMPRAGGRSRGIALVAALIITLVVFILVGSTLYVISQSTSISGLGRAYSTADQAAEACIDLMREAIVFQMNKQFDDLSAVKLGLPGNFEDVVYGFDGATMASSIACTLPAAGMLSYYRGTVAIENLYSAAQNYNIDFTPKAGGGQDAPSTYFRITAVVRGPHDTMAETTVLYRYQAQ